MRVHPIACAAICMLVTSCSAERPRRPAANDPGDVAAAEAPYRRPPTYEPDPLLGPVPSGHVHHPPDGGR